jgi:hypothetical protein
MQIGDDGRLFLNNMEIHLGFGVCHAVHKAVVIASSKPFEQEEWPFCSVVGGIDFTKLVDAPGIMRHLALMFADEKVVSVNPLELNLTAINNGYMALEPNAPDDGFNQTYLLIRESNLELLGGKVRI